jgi:hypothetical protein
MKRFSERHPGEKPRRGFLANCRSCGEVVVHSSKTLEPFHMHRRSKKCREASVQTRIPGTDRTARP